MLKLYVSLALAAGFCLFLNQITIGYEWCGVKRGAYWMVDYNHYQTVAVIETATRGWVQIDSN